MFNADDLWVCKWVDWSKKRGKFLWNLPRQYASWKGKILLSALAEKAQEHKEKVDEI